MKCAFCKRDQDQLVKIQADWEKALRMQLGPEETLQIEVDGLKVPMCNTCLEKAFDAL